MKNLFYNLSMYICNKWILHLPFHSLRMLYYRRVMGFKIGKKSSIHMGAKFKARRRLTIGENCVINEDCVLGNRTEIEIGNCVVFGPQVWIHTSDHDMQDPNFGTRYAPVLIEDYAFVGLRSTVLKGIKIEYGAVIGAGSLVTKSCKPYSINVGSPAKEIGKRNCELKYKPHWAPFLH